MAEPSVILEGVDSTASRAALYSTVHGAGRVMSRTKAAGRSRWKGGTKVRISEGEISDAERLEAVRSAEVVLRGGGNDEAPRAYKRLDAVLDAHAGTIRVLHRLRPMGVAMAGEDEYDPFKD
jgi:tRNA-splicing ligase RtcB